MPVKQLPDNNGYNTLESKPRVGNYESNNKCRKNNKNREPTTYKLNSQKYR